LQKLETECSVIYYKVQDLDQDDIYLSKADFALIIMTNYRRQPKKFGSGKMCINGTHSMNGYDWGSEVVGVAYFSVYSTFIADQARNPFYTITSLKTTTSEPYWR